MPLAFYKDQFFPKMKSFTAYKRRFDLPDRRFPKLVGLRTLTLTTKLDEKGTAFTRRGDRVLYQADSLAKSASRETLVRLYLHCCTNLDVLDVVLPSLRLLSIQHLHNHWVSPAGCVWKGATERAHRKLTPHTLRVRTNLNVAFLKHILHVHVDATHLVRLQAHVGWSERPYALSSMIGCAPKLRSMTTTLRPTGILSDSVFPALTELHLQTEQYIVGVEPWHRIRISPPLTLQLTTFEASLTARRADFLLGHPNHIRTLRLTIYKRQTLFGSTWCLEDLRVCTLDGPTVLSGGIHDHAMTNWARWPVALVVLSLHNLSVHREWVKHMPEVMRHSVEAVSFRRVSYATDGRGPSDSHERSCVIPFPNLRRMVFACVPEHESLAPIAYPAERLRDVTICHTKCAEVYGCLHRPASYCGHSHTVAETLFRIDTVGTTKACSYSAGELIGLMSSVPSVATTALRSVSVGDAEWRFRRDVGDGSVRVCTDEDVCDPLDVIDVFRRLLT